MDKCRTITFSWNSDMDKALARLTNREPDKPSRSVMLRRILARAAGMKIRTMSPGRGKKIRVEG